MGSQFTRRFLLGSAVALAAGAVGTAVFLSRPAVAQEKDSGSEKAKDTVPEKDAAEPKGTATLKGKAAPDFAVKTMDGKDVKLSQYKGKVVVLDFWATWCPPCVKGLPHLDELAKDKARIDKGLVVLAMNLQEAPERVQKFMDDKKLTLNVAIDVESKVSEAYLIDPLPTTVVIDRDGKVAEVFTLLPDPVTKLDEAVDKVLAAPKK